MHAELTQLRQYFFAQGYPSNSHTNIFGHITTYGDSARQDPEMAVPQRFLDTVTFKNFSAGDFAATALAPRDS
jgi:hypothetical protein